MPSDIVGSEVLEESAGGKRSFRFIPGPIFGAAADGRRDQPRLAAHAIGAAAGDAGTACDRRRQPPRRSAPLPCARDAEPDRAGRHLSAARSAARPLPDADRRRLSRPRERAEDRVRHHRHGREQAEGDDERRRASRRAAAGAPPAGRRVRRRRDPHAGARGASRTGDRRARQADLLGPEPACVAKR